MKFFCLVFGEMSLRTLNDLISMNERPEFVVTHKSYLYDEYKEKFYDKLAELCSGNSIRLINADNISKLKDEIEKCDLGISLGFMEIIKPEIFGIPRHGILNLHCGKLPQYRGRAPISRTIMDGNVSLFTTLHKIDSGVDSGPVLIEKEIVIEDDDDVNTLYYKCSFNSASLVRDGIELLRMGRTDMFSEQESLNDYPPHQKLSEEERRIIWSKSNTAIFNKIRAMSYPYPPAFASLNGKRYYINKSKPVYSDKDNGKPGTIVESNNDFIVAAAGKGLLMCYNITDENHHPAEFVTEFKKGDIFE